MGCSVALSFTPLGPKLPHDVSPSRRKSSTVLSSSRPATVVPLRFSERMGSQPAAFNAAIWIDRSWSTMLALAYPTLAIMVP
jgi:hypothetical protein